MTLQLIGSSSSGRKKSRSVAAGLDDDRSEENSTRSKDPLVPPHKDRPPDTQRSKKSVSISFRNKPSLSARLSPFQAQLAATKALLVTPKYVLDAESQFVQRWDVVITLALVFTALVTPYEVALLTTTLNPLFFINRFIDLIFITDMGINFFMSYWEDNDFEASGTWVKDLRKIRQHYFRGWFWIDLVSIMPFDVISFFDTSGSSSKLKVVRIIRVLRLLKMARVLKASRIFRRAENGITLPYSAQALVRFTLMILFGGHWLACVWCLAGMIGMQNGARNWITGLLDSNGDWELESAEQSGHFYIYTAGLYYAIMTISSIGYGNIVPRSTPERWAGVAIMLCGSAVWAYVIGNASGIVVTMDADGVAFHQTMDHLNHFLRLQPYPPELRRLLRAYFRATRQLQTTRRNHDLVATMSPELRNIVAVRSARWVGRVPWCRGVHKDFVAAMVQKMAAAVFSPGEVMPSVNHLCVVGRGVASKAGVVLMKGSHYGMDIVLQSTFLKHKTPARSLTFAELLYIRKRRFFELLHKFPKDAKVIRRYALRLAMQRGMVLIHRFALTGWAYLPGKTTIPFVDRENLAGGVGKKYERFVRQLHPALLPSPRDREDVYGLIRATEAQEHEAGVQAGLLGHDPRDLREGGGGDPFGGGGAGAHDDGRLDRDLREVEGKVAGIRKQVVNYGRAVDHLLDRLAEDGDPAALLLAAAAAAGPPHRPAPAPPPPRAAAAAAAAAAAPARGAGPGARRDVPEVSGLAPSAATGAPENCSIQNAAPHGQGMPALVPAAEEAALGRPGSSRRRTSACAGVGQEGDANRAGDSSGSVPQGAGGRGQHSIAPTPSSGRSQTSAGLAAAAAAAADGDAKLFTRSRGPSSAAAGQRYDLFDGLAGCERGSEVLSFRGSEESLGSVELVGGSLAAGGGARGDAVAFLDDGSLRGEDDLDIVVENQGSRPQTVAAPSMGVGVVGNGSTVLSQRGSGALESARLPGSTEGRAGDPLLLERLSSVDSVETDPGSGAQKQQQARQSPMNVKKALEMSRHSFGDVGEEEGDI